MTKTNFAPRRASQSVSPVLRSSFYSDVDFSQTYCHAIELSDISSSPPSLIPIASPVNTSLMSVHLRMIAEEAGDDVHVVLVLDGAGWHKANGLVVPDSMTLLFLPPYAPELMPMERVWQWMRQHDLSNRVFEDEAAIDQACKHSWNALGPERLKSITATAWLTHER